MKIAAVACVLVHYRYPEVTLRCLESLRKARSDRLKILVVDNAPEDGSGAAVRVFLEGAGMDFAFLEASGNPGFAAGVNLGARAAMELGITHILVLNNDVTVDESFTDRVLEAVSQHPEDVLTGCVLDEDTGAPSFNIAEFSPWTLQLRHIFDRRGGEVEFISGCLMVAPASVLRRVGLWDESYFMYCEDMDFCLRLEHHGIRRRRIPSILVRHRLSSTTSRSRTPLEYYRIRNQTHATLKWGKPHQRGLYLALLPVMLAYKLVRRPGLFRQALRGAWHGLSGRRGKTHED